MKRGIEFLGVIAAFMIIPDTSRSADLPKGNEDLRGTWIVESVRMAIEPLTWLEEGAKGGTLVITADQIQFKGERGTESWPYTLDPTKKPAAIDFSEENKKITRGIYKLEGDKLTICLANYPDKKRPTEFKAKPDPDGQGLLVLKRKKP